MDEAPPMPAPKAKSADGAKSADEEAKVEEERVVFRMNDATFDMPRGEFERILTSAAHVVNACVTHYYNS